MTEHEDLIAEVREEHISREAIVGYLVKPGESVDDDYVETCICKESYPCRAVRLASALEKVTAERDEALGLVDRMAGSQQFFSRLTEAEAERDAAYAVVEQVSRVVENFENGDEDFDAEDTRKINRRLRDALEAIPAEALRDVKAQAWNECVERVRNMGRLDESGIQWLADSANPYRKGESNE